MSMFGIPPGGASSPSGSMASSGSSFFSILSDSSAGSLASSRSSVASSSSGPSRSHPRDKDGKPMKHVLLDLRVGQSQEFKNTLSIPILDALRHGHSQSSVQNAVRSFQSTGYLRSDDFIGVNDQSEWLGAESYSTFNPEVPAELLGELELWRGDDLVPSVPGCEAMRVESGYRNYMCAVARLNAILGFPGTGLTLQNYADLRLLAPPVRQQINTGNLPLDPITKFRMTAPFKPNTFIFGTRYDEILAPNPDGSLESWVPVMLLLSRSEEVTWRSDTRQKAIAVLLSPNHYLLSANGLYNGRPEYEDVMGLYRFWRYFTDEYKDMKWFLSEDGAEMTWTIERSSIPGDSRLFAVPVGSASSPPTVYSSSSTPSDEGVVPNVIVEKTVDGEFQYGTECGICMDQYEPGNAVSSLPCQHTFHFACVNHWLHHSRGNACPYCRTLVRKPKADDFSSFHSPMDVDSEGSPTQGPQPRSQGQGHRSGLDSPPVFVLGTSSTDGVREREFPLASFGGTAIQTLDWVMNDESGGRGQGGIGRIDIDNINTEQEWNAIIQGFMTSTASSLGSNQASTNLGGSLVTQPGDFRLLQLAGSSAQAVRMTDRLGAIDGQSPSPSSSSHSSNHQHRHP